MLRAWCYAESRDCKACPSTRNILLPLAGGSDQNEIAFCVFNQLLQKGRAATPALV